MVAPNDILGSYRLIERIGAGGMGEVWKAEDTKLGRIVAVKILPSAVAADHEATARMRREARTAAQHNHPNIATIHSFEEIGDPLFIVMEQKGPRPQASSSTAIGSKSSTSALPNRSVCNRARTIRLRS